MTVHVSGPQHERPRRHAGRAALVGLALMVLVALAAAGAWWWLDRDGDAPPSPEPLPSPTATPAQPGMTAEQATALVYDDWRHWRQVAECFTEAGFPREPYLRDETARVPRVADFLQVEAATTDPDLPTPDLRWAALDDPAVPDDCLPDAPAPRVIDDAALVDAARDDDAFLTALGEYAWAAENPGRAHLAWVRVADPATSTQEDPDAQARWETLMRDVVDGLGAAFVLTEVEATDQYGQAAGVSASGDGVVVRVSEPGFSLLRVGGSTQSTRCADVLVSLSADLDRSTSAFVGFTLACDAITD